MEEDFDPAANWSQVVAEEREIAYDFPGLTVGGIAVRGETIRWADSEIRRLRGRVESLEEALHSAREFIYELGHNLS